MMEEQERLKKARNRMVYMDIKCKRLVMPCWLAHEIKERLENTEVTGSRGYTIMDID